MNTLTPKEAAPLLGVSYWTVLLMIKEKQIHTVTIGRRKRIPKSEVERVQQIVH